MDNFRLAIIGPGDTGAVHAARVAAGKIADCEFAAVGDAVEAKRRNFHSTRLRTKRGSTI